MNRRDGRRPAAKAYSSFCMAGFLAIWLLTGFANSAALAADASPLSADDSSDDIKPGKSHIVPGEDPSSFRPAISPTLPAYSIDDLGDAPKSAAKPGDVNLSQIPDPLPSSTNAYLAPTPLPPSSDAPMLSAMSDPFYVDLRQQREARKHKLADQN